MGEGISVDGTVEDWPNVPFDQYVLATVWQKKKKTKRGIRAPGKKRVRHRGFRDAESQSQEDNSAFADLQVSLVDKPKMAAINPEIVLLNRNMYKEAITPSLLSLDPLYIVVQGDRYNEFSSAFHVTE